MLLKAHSIAVDYSFDRPNLNDIKAAGYEGVIRYVGWSTQTEDTGDKIISNEEASRIYQAGLGLLLVHQKGKFDAHAGYNGGLASGLEAIAHAKSLGYSAPLFCAIDFDTPLTGIVTDYITGFSRTVRDAGYQSGVYGGVAIVEPSAQLNIVDYFWQTIAWSYGRVAEAAHLHQQDQFRIGGGVVDHNVIRRDIPFYHPTTKPQINPIHNQKENPEMFLVQLLSQQIVLTDGLSRFRLLFDDGTEYAFLKDVVGLPQFTTTDRHVDNFYRFNAGLPMIAED